MKLIFEIEEPINSVWLALTDKTLATDWTGAEAQISDQPGAEFSLWGGDVWGKNIKVVKPQTLIQEWSTYDWDKPSIVTINLEDLSGVKTRVYLEHSGIPVGLEDEIEAGWDQYYFTPIKKLLETNK